MNQETSNNNPEPLVDRSIPNMRIALYPQPAEWALIVQCRDRQTDWHPVNREIVLVAEKPPTTILYQNRRYFIHEEKESSAGWVYKMKPAPEGETDFRIVNLSAEALEEEQNEKRISDEIIRKANQSGYYDFLLGWLPVRIQQQLSEKWYFSPEDACRKNALIQFMMFLLLSVFSVIFMMVEARQQNPAAMNHCLNAGFFFYFCLEGFARYFHVKISEEPFGLPILELLDWLYTKIRRKVKIYGGD